MTTLRLLLLPGFLQAALAFILVSRIARGRIRAVREGRASPAKVAMDKSRWPVELHAVTNNYENQFELPVLYFAALALIAATGLADGAMVALSWLFVASRYVHSYIQTKSNHLLWRFMAFATGVFTLMALWAWFAIRLFVTG
ncbi:MAG: MAPEG family protein [Alphaproteobacteria bacterium]|nr:MAPEG family protein [Alphaproteobacteria bacterium]